MRVYNPEAASGKVISLSTDQQRHAKALRVRTIEPIFVFDGMGREYRAEHIEKVSYRCVEEITPLRALKHITLAISCAKGNRMDTLIEKVSELGVRTIIPLICDRSIVKPRVGKIARWKKISIEACAQCGRADLPHIHQPMPLSSVLEKVRDHDRAFFCLPHGRPGNFDAQKIMFIVGPEGGFTDEEIAAAQHTGCHLLTLASTILRIETAGITAASQATLPKT